MTTLPSSGEQRIFPRVSFDGQALIRTDHHAGFMPCEPRNVSMGGVCLRMDEEVELRSEVDVQLVTPHLPQPIQCHGRVNWITARLDVRMQPPIPYDVGIEFVGLSPQLRAELQRIIDTWRQQHTAVSPRMTRPILIRVGDLTVTAEFNASATAQALCQILPIDSTVHRWGDELYCATPVVAAPESPTQEVRVGDLGYWIEGQSLCLFFGRTPASIDERPRPAVPVNLIGRFTLDERLRSIHDGLPIQICAP